MGKGLLNSMNSSMQVLNDGSALLTYYTNEDRGRHRRFVPSCAASWRAIVSIARKAVSSRSSSRSRSVSRMFDSKGDKGPPYGVPSVLTVAIPPSISPAFRYRRISFNTWPSPILCASRDIRMSWLTRSKNFSRSRSTTQRRFCAAYPRAACAASWVLRPGRKP